MNSYGLIDLHCDTLAEYWKYAHTGNPDTLDDPGRVLSLSNMPKDVHWAQFYAVFIPDEERGRPPSTTSKRTARISTARWRSSATASPPAATQTIWRRPGRRARPPRS